VEAGVGAGEVTEPGRASDYAERGVQALTSVLVELGQVALDHSVAHVVEGRMPDGRQNSVELLVATIPALLVMKGHALVGRDKPKDAYDTYYSVRNFDGGPEALAAACSPLLDDRIAKRGFRNIASKFTAREDFGPVTVRRFLTNSGALGEMTPAQVQLDAYEQVRRFLGLLGVR
jgi:hypothetical protein